MNASERLAARIASSRKEERDSVVTRYRDAVLDGVMNEFCHRLEEVESLRYSPSENLRIAINRLKDRL